MELFHTFTVRVAEIGRYVQRIKTEEMKEFNLKGLHVSCLYYIYTQSEGITMKELCEICGEDKAAVSRSLTSLKNDGYIVSEGEDGKRYKTLLKLTEKGKVTAARIYEKINCVLSEVRVDLDPEEEKTFYKILIKICENMDHLCRKYDE